MDAADWDERYRGADLVWGAEPNRWVAAELADVAPGSALDVACGEGRNAIWLAGRGWRVTGTDFSQAGLERAADLAAQAGVGERIAWLHGDAVDGPYPDGPFDAVIVVYLQLTAARRRKAVRQAASTLAEGGVLLVVAHDSTNLTEGVGGPQDPGVLFSPDDVVRDLASLTDVLIERAERVRRPVSTPDGERDAVDLVVRARRRHSSDRIEPPPRVRG
jgi:SAM-dependent methyltransferase